MSKELGLHTNALNFMRSSNSRTRQNNRLRMLQTTAKQDKFFMYKTSDNIQAVAGKEKPAAKDHSHQEISGILALKLKTFKELISIFKRKQNAESRLVAFADFKNILKKIGINIGDSSLSNFVVKEEVEGRQRIGVEPHKFLKYYYS